MKKFLLTLAAAAMLVPAMSAQDKMFVAKNTSFVSVPATPDDQEMTYNAADNTYSATFETKQSGGFKFYTGPAAGTATTWYSPGAFESLGFDEYGQTLSQYEDFGEWYDYTFTASNVGCWYVTKFATADGSMVNQASITVVLNMTDSTITFTCGESQEEAVVTHNYYLRGTSNGAYSRHQLLENDGVWSIEFDVPLVTEPWEIEGTPIDYIGYGFTILDERVTYTTTSGERKQDVYIGWPTKREGDDTVVDGDPEIKLSAENTTFSKVLQDNGAEMYLTPAGRYKFSFNEETYELTIELVSVNNNSITLKFEGVTLVENLNKYFTLMQGAYEDDGNGGTEFNVSEVNINQLTYPYAYGSQFLLAFFPEPGVSISFSGEGKGTTWVDNAGWPNNDNPQEDEDNADAIPPIVIAGYDTANGTTITVSLKGGFTFTFAGEDSILNNLAESVKIQKEVEEVLQEPLDIQQAVKTTVELDGSAIYVITPKEGYGVIVDCTNYEGLAGNKPYSITQNEDGSVTLNLGTGAVGLNFEISLYNKETNIEVTLNFTTELALTPYRLVNVKAEPASNVAGNLILDSDEFTFACQPPVVLEFTPSMDGYIIESIEVDGLNEDIEIVEYETYGRWTVTIPESVKENVSLVITVTEGTTGVSQIGVNGEDVIYNLNGVRVNNVTKGIYIINGKKVVVK